MRRLLSTCLLAGAALAPAAAAQALRLPAPPGVRFDPVIGTRLPLDAVLRDEQGAARPLAALFGRSPVVLVPGYYTCPNLCGTLFEGVLQALALSGLPGGDYRLVGLSVDPRDGAAQSTARRHAYAALLPGGAADLSMLTGDAAALARVQAALGYEAVAAAAPDAAGGALAHAAGFVVADADGRITHYFSGVRFDPAAVRAAVRAAHDGQAQPPSFGQRILLLCAHYAPASGRNTERALAAVRAGALLVLLALGAWIWRRHAIAQKPGRRA